MDLRSTSKHMPMCLAIVFALCLSVPAWADMVYGRVYADSKFQPGDTFIVRISADKTVRVTTDQYKSYSVFLQPGTYQVEFTDKDGALWTGVIQSYSQPARQDISLKKR